LHRNTTGQLGFHVGHGGVVTSVEPNGLAANAGLKPNSRLVHICDKFVSMLSHEQVVEMLRAVKTVTVTIVPPHDDGSVRRSVAQMVVWLI
jgi:signal-induced proliferation-associated 1 like protein 1